MLRGISSECEVQIGSMATSHLDTREFCLCLAWHGSVLSDYKPRVWRQLCGPQRGPLHKLLAFLPGESDDPFFTYFFR